MRRRTWALDVALPFGLALALRLALALSSRPFVSVSTLAIPALGAASLLFGVWYAAAAWTLAPYPF